MTTTPSPPTKDELLEALRSGGRKVTERVRALPAAELEQGRYENGWNGREILAHIASIEWTYPKLIDIAREATPPPAPPRPGEESSAEQAAGQSLADAGRAAEGAHRTDDDAAASGGQASSTPTRIAQGGILSYNDRQVAKRADASVEDLLREFEKNRAATIAAVENVDEVLLSQEIRSAGGITGPLSGVINAVAVLHVLGHVNDIVGAKA
jgi:hypothetical protein